MDCAAHRSQCVPTGSDSSWCSSQSRPTRSPKTKNARATSSTSHPVAWATAMMSGPCTSSPWNACRRAISSGTPSPTKRRTVELVLLAPRLGADPTDQRRELGERRALIVIASESRSPCACTRYQRDAVSTR